MVSTFIFPLFIPGVSTSDTSDRIDILLRLSELHGPLEFGNIAHVIQNLQDVWGSSGIQIGNLDLQEILKITRKNLGCSNSAL
jgi:hypothetical protein